eukprot:scaffold3685_cov102-Isochrysis_galbana.AAC.1
MPPRGSTGSGAPAGEHASAAKPLGEVRCGRPALDGLVEEPESPPLERNEFAGVVYCAPIMP